ncbi:hypothetical protein DFH11DRAFT_1627265 [Phellopilus nigrolimitatus]|nr:hypothetical protein DFH11DRAFT_1627265 [Phellopilus nigrolimitatus]
MPFQSTMSTDEKNRVKSVLSSNNKILMATVARIYYAHPDPSSWTFSGEQGGLAFVKDKNNGLYYFRLVDLQGTRGVLWEHELYEGFTLNEDRPFFHSFAGDDCMIGLVYTDESEATSFLKVVSKKRSAVGKAKANAAKKKAKGSKGSKILKSLISGPQAGSFKHVSHMGYDPEKGFTSDNVDPSWMAFLNQLEQHGVDAALIAENMDFIKDFVRDAQAPKPVKSTSTSAKKPPAQKSPAQKPPVPPTPATRKKSQKGQKPPPPPRRGAHGHSDSASSVQTPVELPAQPSATPPPPPAPPAPASPAPAPPSRSTGASAPPPPAPPRPSGAPPAPPLPPGRPSANGGAPPPPPPPPPPGLSAGGAPPPPPPPPPPPAANAPPPPPPPPPPGAPPPPPPTSLPAAPPARNALLESIQGKGVHTLRKTAGPNEPASPGRVASPPPQSANTSATEEAAAGGGDLAAALAAALNQRNKKLGDSDDEDDEEEWD